MAARSGGLKLSVACPMSIQEGRLLNDRIAWVDIAEIYIDQRRTMLSDSPFDLGEGACLVIRNGHIGVGVDAEKLVVRYLSEGTQMCRRLVLVVEVSKAEKRSIESGGLTQQFAVPMSLETQTLVNYEQFSNWRGPGVNGAERGGAGG